MVAPKILGKGQLRDIAGKGSVINAEGHEGALRRPTEVSVDYRLDQAQGEATPKLEAPALNPDFGKPKKKSTQTLQMVSEGEKKA